MAIAVNTDFLSQISTTTDIDWWSFANTSSAKNIKVTLTTLPADYDVKLYNPSGTLVGTSELSGTSNETIIYNTSTVGTYKIKVYGWSGANSTTVCYTLKAAISNTAFKLEEGMDLGKNAKTQITVFPNPASNNITLRYSGDDEDATIRITNILGQTISFTNQHLAAGNDIQFDVSNFVNGKYFISIWGNEVHDVKMFEVIK
ncbi:MAG: T9SS type A sorting domain-containing protein [Chitinophagales bacterium]|nr:T9SS type A sorting domain-containing protein [Chitinophagales bacterium]